MSTFYRRRGKRLLDLVVGIPALVATAPITAVAAVAVHRTMGSPVFFRQTRPGLDGRPFVFVKLRTMRDARDEQGRVLPDAERLTKLGRFLRASSIDELPSLWHVVRGDMSLVGPRPLLVQYLDRYSSRQARRHEVKPGITGWAQVRGRNALSWADKLEADVWYVDHVSLALDLRILLDTLHVVVLREGVAASGHVSMPEFIGTEEKPTG